MGRAAFACLFLAATTAFAQVDPKKLTTPPSTRWFSLDRTSTGYVAGGNLDGTLWAFHVPGFEMKRLGGADSSTFSVDGKVVQVRAVPRKLIKGADAGMLEAHKRYEQEHQAGSAKGVAFRDHDLCRNAQVPHQQWLAKSGAITQAVVTFEVGNYVLMVVSPYENERRARVVAETLDEVCRSFRREKS